MQFRLWTIFYVMALLGAALATFGAWGILWTVLILAAWQLRLFSLLYAVLSQNKILGIVAAIAVLAWFFVPIVQPHIHRQGHACSNNLAQLTLALHNYHDEYDSFPPATIADENGKPMHSWRVLILPYLDPPALHDQYDFDEPWDGPNNRKLAKLAAPTVYRCPGSVRPTCNTSYFAIVDARTAWPNERSISMKQLARDGTSNTLLLLESHSKGVHWMEPQDISLDEATSELTSKDNSGLHSVEPRDTFFQKETGLNPQSLNVALADGDVAALRYPLSLESAEAFLTVGGREQFAPNGIEFFKHRQIRFQWDKLLSLVLLISLSLLPVRRAFYEFEAS